MRNAELTKEKILKKSGLLFNTKGYKATSISNITNATGFTKGAIYRHFKSKDALEKETLFHLSNITFVNMRDAIKAQSNAPDKLRAVLKHFETYISNPPVKGGCPLLNAAIEADDSNPTLRKAAMQILDGMHKALINILENGIKYKQIKSTINTEFYATIIIASMEGAIMMSKLRGNSQDIKHVLSHLENQISEIAL